MMKFNVGDVVLAFKLQGVIIEHVFNCDIDKYTIKTSSLTLYNVQAEDIELIEFEVGDKVTTNDKIGVITKKVSDDLYRINFNPIGIEEISKIYLTKVKENYNV